MSGAVVSIHVAARVEDPTSPVAGVKAVPGRGLEGDRTFDRSRGDPGRELTLIEIEALEALKRETGIELAPGLSRRNVVTRGVRLNDLVGREFTVGAVKCRGIRLCQPCGHMEGLAGLHGVKDGLRDRGGLRAQILTEGVIRVGDEVTA
jgi:MOSC domain-containing protein YiiM